MLCRSGTSLIVTTLSTHDSLLILDLRNSKFIIVSLLLKSNTGLYVKNKKSLDPYLSFTSLKYCRSLSPSKSRASEEASSLKSLEKNKKKR